MDDSGEGRKFQKKYRHKYKLNRDSSLPFPNYGLGKTELPTICRCYCNVTDAADNDSDKSDTTKVPGENGTGTSEEYKPTKFQQSFSKSCSFYVTHKIDISTLYINGSFGTSSLTHRSPSFLSDVPYQSQTYYKKMKQREEFFLNVDVDLDQYLDSETKPEEAPGSNNGGSSNFVQLNGDNDDKEEEEKLLLLPEEVIFLSFGVGCLSLLDSTNGESLTYNFAWKKLIKLNPNFPYLYAVYHHFRSKNWVAKSGLQYGGDFVLYRAGPELFHSTYVVHIIGIPSQPKPSWTEIYGWQRIAASSCKKTLLCEVIQPKNFTVETPRCIFDIKIFETVIERWFPTPTAT